MSTKTNKVSIGCLPFLTLPDPPVTGEGVLDPLGLATTGDRLADWLLPGLTARMSRPRFLTAIAVSAAVCDGLQDEIAADGVTPAYLVFEWLAVEGFVRKAESAQVVGTPGTLKAKACQRTKVSMSARTYLKTPSVFGFHGVYRRLARDVNIVDPDEILLEHGYQLLKIWEHEQGLDGFLDSASAGSEAAGRRQLLRAAVADGLRAGHSARSAGWQGWQFFADHLAPGSIAPREAEFLWNLLLDVTAGTRGEVFQLLEQPENFAIAEVNPEAELIRHLLPQASVPLAQRLRAIIAYEEFCTLLEAGFDWLRWLSSCAGARAISQGEFCARPEFDFCPFDGQAAGTRAQSRTARKGRASF